MTEPLDKASWALGNQESTDIKIGSYGGGLKVVGGTAITNWVTDVPTGLSLSALDALKAEGSSGTTPFTFLVSRSGDVSGETAVTYTLKGLGANAGDFAGGAFPTGTVTFAPGERVADADDRGGGGSVAGGAESFSVTLSAPTNGAIVTGAVANGTIQNDDTVVGIDVGRGGVPGLGRERAVCAGHGGGPEPVPVGEREGEHDGLGDREHGGGWVVPDAAGEQELRVRRRGGGGDVRG